MFPTFAELARMLATRRTTSRELLEQCLSRIEDTEGEGTRVFLKVHAAQARAAADAVDRGRSLGMVASPYAGIPVSVKDLFDIAGDSTAAGSMVLADAPPAQLDAPAVARLRAAGLVIVGRTNMTEFAYTGLGINPHFGTPKNPFERERGRIPGGSSSGAAISVTDGMAAAGLGTDTGGSCRIPAALTGIAGFKPTARRVSLEGVLPLATSLDSVGSLARSVACCAVMDAILAGATPIAPRPFPLRGLRLAVPETLVLNDMDSEVAAAFERALTLLSGQGAHIVRLPLPELLELSTINAKGGFAAAESYTWHRRLLSEKGDRYDPRVRSRMERGASQSASDYLELCQARHDFIRRVATICAPFDGLLLPTVPRIAPTFAEIEAEDDYSRLNLLMLRNPAVINFIDGCAVSVPCHAPGSAPVGLMVAGLCDTDARLLAIAQAVEAVVAPPLADAGFPGVAG
jgi:aspartyl-tRNA(Asn)/glutamyl-tRNA(Gln) amidotransferase subunit A